MANTRRTSAASAKSNVKASESKRASKPSNSSKTAKKTADVKDAKKRDAKSGSRGLRLSPETTSTSKKPSTPARVQMPTPPTTPRKTSTKRKIAIKQEPSSPSPSPKKSKSRQPESTEKDEADSVTEKKRSKRTQEGLKADARKHKKGDEVDPKLDMSRTSLPSPKKDETAVTAWKSLFLKDSYNQLPNLLKANVDHTSQNKSIEYWSPESILKMNPVDPELYYAALTFSHSGKIFNLSRADPQHLTVPGDTLLCINANSSTSIALCVTTILVEKCHLVKPTTFGNSTDRFVKSISGYPDRYEWNREEAALHMIYREKDYGLRVFGNCLQFSTLPSAPSADGGGTLKGYVQSGRSSKTVASPDGKDRRSLLRSRAGMKHDDALGKGDRALNCSSKVPIYDGTTSGPDLFDNLENLEANLQECDHDLEFGDVAMVMYTVNKYVANTGTLYLNFNVRCVVLLSSPDGTSPELRNASVDSGAPLLPPFHFASNVTRRYAFLENIEVEEVNDSDLQSMDEESGVGSADDEDLLSEHEWPESEKNNQPTDSENLSEVAEGTDEEE